MLKSLKNNYLELTFDLDKARLTAFTDCSTGEVFPVDEDGFELMGEGWSLSQAKIPADEQVLTEEAYWFSCHFDLLDVRVEYRLEAENAFIEKIITLIPRREIHLKQVVLSRLRILYDSCELVCYPHPSFALIEAQFAMDYPKEKISRPLNSEPCRTFFGRTEKGGFMAGVAVAFDSSTLTGNQLTLAFNPNMKLKTGEPLVLEPVYLGVYQRCRDDRRAEEWQPDWGMYIHHGSTDIDSKTMDAFRKELKDRLPSIKPLPSESRAMVALTGAMLGKRRKRQLVAAACGWHSEMEQWEYSEESAEADCRAIDLLADCGIDWLSESHPWGGETKKMNQMKEDDQYQMGPLTQKVLSHAKEKGLKVIQWASMNNTHPWSSGEGRTFLEHKGNWLRVPAPQWRGIKCDSMWDCWPHRFQAYQSHCIANQPFWEWITDLNLQVLDTALFGGWVMDGDFWGTGAFFQTTIPVECYAENHDHLPGDANYACQKALERWVEKLIAKFPDLLITMCRPPMDLGVWAQRNVDACFTLIETGTGKSNLAGGNEIRMASRIRVHQHFFPHWIDWSLLFPSFANPNTAGNVWSGEHLDYILLSALSCTPNLLMYIPARSGIPVEDRQEIRKWLDWGRWNIEYLFVRKDLFDYPAPDKVDGSAHVLEDDRGIVFLFNPNRFPKEAVFEVSREAIGVNGGPDQTYFLWQEYPVSSDCRLCRYGDSVSWRTPAEGAVLLRIKRARSADGKVK